MKKASLVVTILVLVIEISTVRAQILTSEVKVESISGLTSIKGLTIPSRYYNGKSTNGSAIEIEIPNAGFNAIRGYNGSQHLGDFFFFDVEWPHESAGAINISGIQAVTLGSWSNPTAYFRKEDGYVGIGTTSPTHKLTVNGTSSSQGLKIPGKYNFGKSTNGSAIEIEVSNGGFNAIRGFNGDQSIGDFYFFDDTWAHSSSGAINLKGITAVTIGPWSNPSAYFRTSDGFVGIGTENPTNRLEVNGTVRANTFSAVTPPWSDFVFDDNYELQDLEEVENFIRTNKHLPEIPSEKELQKTGLDLPAMDSKLLQKIEELTLYVIEINKRLNQVESENIQLKEKIQAFENE